MAIIARSCIVTDEVSHDTFRSFEVLLGRQETAADRCYQLPCFEGGLRAFRSEVSKLGRATFNGLRSTMRPVNGWPLETIPCIAGCVHEGRAST